MSETMLGAMREITAVTNAVAYRRRPSSEMPALPVELLP